MKTERANLFEPNVYITMLVKLKGNLVESDIENAVMSNQTSGIVLKYRYNPKYSFEENTRQVHKRIYKNLQNVNVKYFVFCFIEQLSPTLLDSVLLYTHGCYQHKISKKFVDIMGYTGNNGRDFLYQKYYWNFII